MNDILAWQASDVGTGAADQLAFYDGRVLTFLGHRPGYVFSCFAASQHKILISLNLGHGGPPSDLSRFRQSLPEKHDARWILATACFSATRWRNLEKSELEQQIQIGSPHD